MPSGEEETQTGWRAFRGVWMTRRGAAFFFFSGGERGEEEGREGSGVGQ